MELAPFDRTDFPSGFLTVVYDAVRSTLGQRDLGKSVRVFTAITCPCRNLQSKMSTANRPCRNLQSKMPTAYRPCRDLQHGMPTALWPCGNLRRGMSTAPRPCRNLRRGMSSADRPRRNMQCGMSTAGRLCGNAQRGMPVEISRAEDRFSAPGPGPADGGGRADEGCNECKCQRIIVESQETGGPSCSEAISPRRGGISPASSRR